MRVPKVKGKKFRMKTNPTRALRAKHQHRNHSSSAAVSSKDSASSWLEKTVKSMQGAGCVCVCVSLPDSLDVHGLRVPQPLSGGGQGSQGRHVMTMGLSRSQVGGVVLVVVVVVVVMCGVHMAIVQKQRRVRLGGVHTLHGRVHVIHQLLQVHVIICGETGEVEKSERR